MADLPPGVIPVSFSEYNRLYPLYEKAKATQPGLTFQQWLKATQMSAISADGNRT